MTQNQLAYQRNLEEARANRVSEQELARSHQANEAISGKNAETSLRGVKVSEDLADSQKFVNYTKGAEQIAGTVDKTTHAIKNAADTAVSIVRFLG